MMTADSTRKLSWTKRSKEDDPSVSFAVVRRLALLTCVCFCLGIIVSFLIDFFSFSTIQTVTIDTKSLAVFPAVTVCNLNRIRKTNLCMESNREEWEAAGLEHLLEKTCSNYSIPDKSSSYKPLQDNKVARKWSRADRPFPEPKNNNPQQTPKDQSSETDSENKESRVVFPDPLAETTTTVEPEDDEVPFRVKIIPKDIRRVPKSRGPTEDKFKRDGMIGISSSKNLPGSYKTLSRRKRSGTEHSEGENSVGSNLKHQGMNVDECSVSSSLAQNLVAYHSLNESQKYRLGHDFHEMFLGCEFNGEHCTLEEFSTFLSVPYGNCYTIDKSKTRIYAVGQLSGFNLELATEFDQYVEMEPESLLAAGFRVVLHPSDEPPDPVTQGFDISAGFETNVAINQMDFERTKSPYLDHCKDYGQGILKDFPTRQDCIDSCIQERSMFTCQCTSPHLDHFGIGAPCRIDNHTSANCLKNVREAIFNNSEICNCPSPCRERKYQFSTSLSKLQAIHEQEEKSIARLRIHFTTMDRTVYRSIPKYRVHHLFTSLGGVFALWFGISVMTLVELFCSYLERVSNERQEKHMQHWIRDLNNKNRSNKSELAVTANSIKCYDIT